MQGTAVENPCSRLVWRRSFRTGRRAAARVSASPRALRSSHGCQPSLRSRRRSTTRLLIRVTCETEPEIGLPEKSGRRRLHRCPQLTPPRAQRDSAFARHDRKENSSAQSQRGASSSQPNVSGVHQRAPEGARSATDGDRLVQHPVRLLVKSSSLRALSPFSCVPSQTRAGDWRGGGASVQETAL